MKINLSGIPTGEEEKDLLRRAAELTVKQISPERKGQINVALVDKVTSRRLNHTYAGHNYATDVLSFNYEQSEELGDIVICLPIARSQARAAGNSLTDELALLCVHGVMHVLGRDHCDQPSQARFARTQNAIVKMLGRSKRDYKWLP